MGFANVRWTVRPPIGQARVDAANPLASGLVRLVIFDGAFAVDLVTGDLLRGRSGQFVAVETVYGAAARNPSAVGNLSIPVRSETTRSMSAAWLGSAHAFVGAGIILRDETGAGGSIPLWMNGGGWVARMGGTTYTAAGSAQLDVTYCALVSSGDSGVRVHVNGSQVMAVGVAGTEPLVSPWGLHRNGVSDGVGVDGTVSLFAIWDRPLSADEASLVTSDPFQLFEPRRIWVSQATASPRLTLINGQLVHKLPGPSDLQVFLDRNGMLTAALTGGTAMPIDLDETGRWRANPA